MLIELSFTTLESFKRMDFILEDGAEKRDYWILTNMSLIFVLNKL